MAPPPRGPGTARLSPSTALAAVDDLQGEGADLGWPEATGLADSLVDALSHLLVDLGAGHSSPTPRPAVVGAIGGPAGPLDHASCRTAAAALRRAGGLLVEGGQPWTQEAAAVAMELADLLDRCAELARSGRLPERSKGVVLRRLRGLQRRLHALG